jgi:hypothetical protein
VPRGVEVLVEECVAETVPGDWPAARRPDVRDGADELVHAFDRGEVVLHRVDLRAERFQLALRVGELRPVGGDDEVETHSAHSIWQARGRCRTKHTVTTARGRVDVFMSLRSR